MFCLLFVKVRFNGVWMKTLDKKRAARPRVSCVVEVNYPTVFLERALTADGMLTQQVWENFFPRKQARRKKGSARILRFWRLARDVCKAGHTYGLCLNFAQSAFFHVLPSLTDRESFKNDFVKFDSETSALQGLRTLGLLAVNFCCVAGNTRAYWKEILHRDIGRSGSVSFNFVCVFVAGSMWWSLVPDTQSSGKSIYLSVASTSYTPTSTQT